MERESKMKVGGERQRLFVDMDGTLVVFKTIDTIETLYEKGYFAELEPIPNTINAIRSIIEEHPEIEVHVLSAYLEDSKYALQEKNSWLNQYLPEIDPKKRIFVPCGEDKKEYIPEGIRATDYLIDDYTLNLVKWQPPAKGIKLLNGINHTKGTWEHDCISCKKDASVLAQNIVDVMKGKVRIKDQKPDLENKKLERSPRL